MTQATNLQLTYDNATNKWDFTEVAYNYGDRTPPSWSGYTTADPAFEYATEDTSGNRDTNTDPCPPGYIYDEELKQCVVDANYQAPTYAGEPGTEKEEDAGPYKPLGESYPNTMTRFSREDMFRWGLDKGYIDKFGNIIGPMQATVPGWLGSVGQVGNEHQFNQWIQHAKDKGIFKEMAGKPGEVSGIISFGGPPQPIMDSWTKYMNTINLDTTTGFQEVKKTVIPGPKDYPWAGAPGTTVPKPQASPSLLQEVSPGLLEEERKQEIHNEKVKQEEEKTEILRQEKQQKTQERDKYESGSGDRPGGHPGREPKPAKSARESFARYGR